LRIAGRSTAQSKLRPFTSIKQRRATPQVTIRASAFSQDTLPVLLVICDMEAEMGKSEIKWLEQPGDTNYPAAQSYLTLCFPEKKAKALVKKLRSAPMTTFKAKDIFRACRLTLLLTSR
jgi:hypothetical protein